MQLEKRERLELPLTNPIIVIHKLKRELHLYSGGVIVRVYKVRVGASPEDKAVEGDRRTPEGDFYVFVKNPESSYHLSLGLSYPNIEDAARGLRENLISQTEHDSIIDAIRNGVGPPQTTALGGFIYIHGEGGSKDWTRGCIALENADIEELYEAVSVGTPISIKP